MDIFVTRQPIFDRNMQVFGYKLLYSNNNSLPLKKHNMNTAELLYNSFFVVGMDNITDRTKAFLDFSEELLEIDLSVLLPIERIIVEIHERNKMLATVESCEKIKSLGFSIALDGCILDQDNISLLNLVDFVNIDYPSASFNSQYKMITKFKTVKFIAEGIETREDYRKADELGYDIFKGNFFSTPTTVNSKEIETLTCPCSTLLKSSMSPSQALLSYRISLNMR